MDKYRSNLVEMSQSPLIDNQISMLRTKNILRTAKQPQIYVSSFPSNLVEPLKLGQKYAPDSCVQNGALKYVWGGGLIKSGPAPFTIESKKKTELTQPRPIDYSPPSLIIPELIIRNRPGISLPIYQKEQILIPNKPQSLKTPKKTAKQEQIEFKPQEKQGILKQTPKRIPARKTLKASPAKPKLDSQTKKKTKKPILKKESKIVKIPEIKISSNTQESPKKTVTWRESGEEIQQEPYIRQTDPVERHKIPSYLSQSKSPAEKSLQQLERIVQQQQDYLKQQGMEFQYSENQDFNPQDKLDKEIAQIKMILNEQEDQDNFLPENLEYSPDQAPEQASFDEWLSPRFPEEKQQTFNKILFQIQTQNGGS